MSLAVEEIQDAGIRKAYGKAIKSGKVSLAEMKDIIEVARDATTTKDDVTIKDFISSRERADLNRILDKAVLTKDAKEALEKFIADRKKQKDPSTRKELGTEGRERVANVIDELGAVVRFEDPEFKTVYGSMNYGKISKRIRTGKTMKVFFYEYIADDALKGRAKGTYLSSKNELSYTKQSSFMLTNATILHEATHAVQDIVINQNMQRYHAEAMAHIAQAIATIKLYGEGVLAGRLKEMKDIANKVAADKKATKAQVEKIIKIFQSHKVYENGNGLCLFGDT